MRKLLIILLFLFVFSIPVLATDYHMDYENGDDVKDGLSWANAWKTFDNTNTISAGDRLKMAKSPGPVSLGNATWTAGESYVTLATAATLTIDNCENEWTASPDVSASTTTSYLHQGDYQASINIGSNFTTGKVAYYQLPAELNCSGYQVISFWFQVSSTKTANMFKICLCSDTTGDTIVDSAVINWDPQSYAPYRAVIDTGSALGSSIKSVALYADSDPGSISVYIDNIFVANGFHLRSLISKNTSGMDKIWYMPESIDGTTVGTCALAYNTVYAGTSETVTTYYRNCIQLAQDTHYDNVGRFEVLCNGTSGNLCTFSGGWNTSTDVQDGETFFMGKTISYNKGLDGIFYIYRKNYIKFEKLGAFVSCHNFYFYGVRYQLVMENCWAGDYWYRGMHIEDYSPGLSVDLDYCYVGYTAQTAAAIYLDLQDNSFSESYAVTLDNCYVSSCYTPLGSQGWNREVELTNSRFGGNKIGLRMEYSLKWVVDNCVFDRNEWNIYLSGWNRDCVVKNSSFTNPRTGQIWADYGAGLVLQDCVINDFSRKDSNAGGIVKGYWNDSPKFFISKDGDEIYWEGTVSDQITAGYSASDARGGSGYCVVLDPQQTESGKYLRYIVAVPVTNSAAFNISFYHKITSGFNGSLTFSAEGAGITPIEDASVTLTDDGVWHQYTSSEMTPSADGWVKITLKPLNGAVSGDILLDDFEISAGADKDFGDISGGFPMFEHDTIIGGGIAVTTAFTYTE